MQGTDTPKGISEEAIGLVRHLLLPWYRRHARVLPWREGISPYRTWVSEVMLQQTQVDRVVPYFHRFMEAFPTVEALAAAPIDQVLGLWSGLGYYSRARSLHDAAQVVAKEHSGHFPNSVEGLLELPGIGRYTAGAIASIALDLEAPIVDGNVARVLARVFEIEGNAQDKGVTEQLWSFAERLVRGKHPGDLNQSMMELGATVCLPKNPTCLLCPLREVCLARAHGRIDEIPRPRKAAPRKQMQLAVGLVTRKKNVLFAKRHGRGLFGGLWELPSAPVGDDDNSFAPLFQMFGKRSTIGPEMFRIERTLTHRELTMRVHPVVIPQKLKRAPDTYEAWRFFAPEELADAGLSSATRHVLRQALPDLFG